MKKQKSKGYLIVASVNKRFYQLGINCAESILDYNPEAKITFVTEERFIDDQLDQFDQVLTCPSHYRSKLYGMMNTPYDITLYVDADMECHSEDVSKAFDMMGENSIMFTPINEFNGPFFRFVKFDEIRQTPMGDDYKFELNGGICLYDITDPLVKDLLQDWWDYYKKQRNDFEWWPLDNNGYKDMITYPKELAIWDQFTLWWLVNKEPKYKDLKLGIIEEWYRWNYYTRFEENKVPKDDVIFLHHSGCNKS